jgi:methyl-accepting chemotaxis protein
MKNWTIGKRVVAISSLLVALLLAIGATAYLNLKTISAEARTIRDDNVAGLVQSGLINGSLKDSFIRTILAGQAATPDEREKYIKQQEGLSAVTGDAIAKYESSIFFDEDRRLFNIVKEERANYGEARAKFYAAVRSGDQAAQKTIFNTALLPIYLSFTKAGDDLMAYNAKQGTDQAEAIVEKALFVNTTILISSLFAIGLGIALSTIIIRSINKVLRGISETLESSASQVAAASSQVSSASQTLASGSSEQAASLEETSASLEEISSMTKRNSENAGKANELTRTTRTTADKGAADMESMARAMQEIKASSDDIAKIIKTIDEIAFQTNILALNAAVEAARAGEAGAGFAVVADEVRNLAQRAAQSAKETALKIEGAITKTAQGVEISADVQKSLQQIVEQVRTVDELVSEVAQASNEQSQGIGQVGTAVRQMDQVTQGNAASAEETASASEELSAQAESLKDVVGQLLLLVGGATAKAATPHVVRTAPHIAHAPVKVAAPGPNGKNGHAPRKEHSRLADSVETFS